MSLFISWADHIPTVEIPLHVPRCLCSIDTQPLHSSEFCTHHFSSIFEVLLKTLSSKQERFSAKDDVWYILMKQKFIIAGKTG